MFTLLFEVEQIPHWATQYAYPQGDEVPVRIGGVARANGYLSREEFLTLAKWKSARPGTRHLRNDAETVREVTAFALSTKSEVLRLRSLTLLSGVADRTASAILHFCHRDPYPLMDIRAFGALGVTKLPHDWSSLWPQYTAYCRDLAARAKVDMRTLDRALWAYSDAHGLVAG